MFAKERYEHILKLIEQHGSVTVNELMSLFDVSIETVRKDLLKLERENRLERVHGGAVAINRVRSLLPLSERLKGQVEEKNKVCEVLKKVIHEHDIIALDTGATATEVADMLCRNYRHLTVITPSIQLFQTLHCAGFHAIMIGGEYVEAEDTFAGPIAISTFKSLRAAKCLIFPTSVSLRHGVGMTRTELLENQRVMMQISDQTYVVADSSKFETTSLIKSMDVTPECIFVTDDGLDERICELYRMNKIRVYRTPEDVTE